MASWYDRSLFGVAVVSGQIFRNAQVTAKLTHQFWLASTSALGPLLGGTAALLSRLGQFGLRQGQRPPQNPGPTPAGSDVALALTNADPATDAVDAVFSNIASISSPA